MWTEAITRQVSEILEEQKVPGAVLSVAQHGQIIYEAAFGYRDVAAQLPATTDTLFGAGSITKSMTALAILLLAEEGRLSINDPVLSWLPSFRLPANTEQVTIHHLLTHSTGLPDTGLWWRPLHRAMSQDPNFARLGFPLNLSEQGPIESCDALLEAIKAQEFELLGAPGEAWSYCNEGYYMLGEIIRRASGRSYDEFVQERILAPLGLTQSVLRESDLARFPRVTELYHPSADGAFHAPGWWDVGEMMGCGGLKTTLRDLTRYLEIFCTGGLVDGQRYVSESVIRQMTTGYVPAWGPFTYGYGLYIQSDYHGHTMIEHTGAEKGVSAIFRVVPDLGLTAVAMANLSETHAVGAMVDLALKAAMGQP